MLNAFHDVFFCSAVKLIDATQEFFALYMMLITAFHGFLGVNVNLVPSTAFYGGKKRRYIFTNTQSSQWI